MKLGIMQPYFFPYIGYFELINRVDKWVVFDIVQYNKKSWMNRNRILHPKTGWQYIKAPVKHVPGDTLIKDIILHDSKAACRRICGQLEHYSKHAPHYDTVMNIIMESFDQSSDCLTDLNVEAIKQVCRYLDIDFTCLNASELDIEHENIMHPGQWALEIASMLGADEYINPPGGRDIFREAEWEERSIRLNFTTMNNFTYSQAPYDFVENLSVLDVLMWNSPSFIRKTLDGD